MGNILAYGPALAMSCILTAEAIPAIPTIPPQILQGGELAVLAWTIWYVLARTIPAHTAALAAQRDAFLAAGRQDREDG